MHQQQTFHWHILGAGSLGLLFAYHLAKAGHRVSLLGREKTHKQCHVNAIINGQTHRQALTLSHSENCTDIHLLLVTVKAYATANALASVEHALNKNSLVFLLQNGLGQLENISPKIQAQIVPAITQAAAEKTDMLTVIEHAKGQTFLPILSQALYQQALWQSELPITALANFTETQWQKLAINAVINPLTAIYDCRNGEILQLPNYLNIATTVIGELVKIAKAHNIVLDKNALLQTVYAVAQQTSSNSSSMREDIHHKKPTEIDFINGYIVNQGIKLGIATPSNLLLVKQVQQLQGSLC